MGKCHFFKIFIYMQILIREKKNILKSLIREKKNILKTFFKKININKDYIKLLTNNNFII